MPSKKHVRMGLAIGFVVLAAVLLWMLTSPPRPWLREGAEDLGAEVRKLRSEFDAANKRVEDGEKQADAARGNAQVAI